MTRPDSDDDDADGHWLREKSGEKPPVAWGDVLTGFWATCVLSFFLFLLYSCAGLWGTVATLISVGLGVAALVHLLDNEDHLIMCLKLALTVALLYGTWATGGECLCAGAIVVLALLILSGGGSGGGFEGAGSSGAAG